MTKIMEEMDFLVKITRKRGITHFPSFISWKLYFLSLDLELDLLTLKMTFNHQISARNSLFNQKI